MKKNNKRIISVISVFSILTVGAIAAAITNARELEDTQRGVAASYRRAFSEIVRGASELDSALQKSLLVSSTSMAGAVCTDVYAKAQMTSMSLGELPFSATELEKTVSFVNTVGDYAFALAQKSAKGKELTEEDRESLRKLSETASKVSATLTELEGELGSQMVSIDQYRRTVAEYDQNEGEYIPETLADSISMSEQEFPEMPSLIYDGPFSEHLKDSNPRFLEGREEIDETQGRRAAAEFLGMRPEQIYPTGEEEGEVPGFCFGCELNGSEAHICVTKVGGVVVSVIGSRQVSEVILSVEEAQQAAQKLLERWGYENMKPSYYMIDNNIFTANYAYEQDGIICYPDLMKIGIALDDGSLQCFEALGYISAHTERKMPEKAITMEQAKEKIPEGFTVTGEQEAVIPTAGKHELLCYELQCEDKQGRKYIIYVNTVSGEQEKILLLLEDENGTTTI
jgi:germination protein YpeB